MQGATAIRRRSGHGWIPFTAMFVGVVVAGVLPALRFRQFYLSGDSIVQWLPVSRRIGELVAQGESHLMDPSLWRSGNFAGEARFGLWNPIVLGLDATVLQLDNLVAAATLVSLIYLLILSTGVYLLAREYGAAAWPSALAGMVAATGGWTLWMDAAWWTPHLASLAFTPFVWMTARRVARDAGAPIWLLVAGALCVTAGNPYSSIVVGAIITAVAVEFADRSRPAPLFALGGVLVALALIAVFVHLPFQQTSVVGDRETGVFNDGSWVLGVGDLLNLSTPTAQPRVQNFGRSTLGFPGFYLAWFVLPLAPWMRWRMLASRKFAGLGVVGGAVLILLLGPSNLWFFRWPMRLIPYVYLPAIVAVALVLQAGLVDDRRGRRAVASGGIVLAALYLATSDSPGEVAWHVAGAAIVVAATAGAIHLGVRHRSALIPGLMSSVVAVLAFQLVWQPRNESVRHYSMPSTVDAYEQFSTRYEGNIVQIGTFDRIPQDELSADAAYRDLMVGSTAAIAGVEAVSTYSGIGFATHDQALCLRFDGATCPEAWNRLWRPAEGSNVLLADLLAADTVVVQRTTIDTAEDDPPPGWSMSDVTDFAVVWSRDDEQAWPEGRLTDVEGPLVATFNETSGPHREFVAFERTGEGDGRLTFARLAWPGYEATIDGRPLPVGGGPAGLLTVTIPAGVGDGEVLVTWVPPYWRPSLAVLAVGLSIGIGTQLLWWRRSRRRSSAAS